MSKLPRENNEDPTDGEFVVVVVVLIMISIKSFNQRIM